MGEPLLELLEHIEVVTWREAMSEHSEEFDIAIVEGSITRDSDLPRLRRIRQQARVLVALGSCATLGGPHVSANHWEPAELLRLMYGDQAGHFETAEVRPLGAVVPVDVPLYGCPINPEEFLVAMQHLLLGATYRPPNRPVCHECKLNQYECVYDRGQVCLGPVTRCGCNAICTSRGHQCFGCRGLVDDPNLNAARDVLAEHGYELADVIRRFDLYSARSAVAAKVWEAARQAQMAMETRREPWRSA